MAESNFTCDSDIRIEHPFDDDRLWSFWAAHNCPDYSLILTVVLSEEVMGKIVGFYGAELSKTGCSRSEQFDYAVSCDFVLNTVDKGFGMLFAGSFSPVLYLSEWRKNNAGDG